MCIGNRGGGDDAIGPYIADQLKKETLKDTLVLDCGTIPENYTSIVKKHKPNTLILIDATDMGLEPGEIRLIPKHKIGTMHISTHGIPLSILMNYLEEYVENILFLGIQSKSMVGLINKIVKKNGNKLILNIINNNLCEIRILK